MTSLSLRARLTGIILLPLLTIAAIVGLWQLNNARLTATGVFDRALLSAALAVTNDVAISGGDALSARTRDLLSDTSGGPVFYHVYAPDGVIVAGYATPPVGIPQAQTEVAQPTFFSATYLGRPVSGVRLQSQTQIEGFSGIFTTTVWQDTALRTVFVRDLVLRSLITISALIASLALIVWFGVRLGLRPLTDLENAIAERSSDELTPIRRAVPVEVKGVVTTLNRLFTQVSRTMAAQAEFIGNAAHQLRNPIAGVLSLAEAAANAPDETARKERTTALLTAAQDTADLSQKLLLLERATALSPAAEQHPFELGPALTEWLEALPLPNRITLKSTIAPDLGILHGDPTMLREAVVNLIDNAVRHGGPSLSQIDVTAARSGDQIHVTIADNGIGIPKADLDRARQRFAGLAPTSASGLGLSIVEAIVTGHGGTLDLSSAASGLTATLALPSSR